MDKISIRSDSQRAQGLFLGLCSSAAFGMIPLFSLPLFHSGITVQTTLLYRFSIAALVIWLILLPQKNRISLPLQDLLKIAFLSLMYLLAVVAFFHAFSYLPSGVVATIQFLYPVMVMLIMIFFFHEKFYWHVAWAVMLAVCGVALLSLGSSQEGPARDALGGVSSIAWGVFLSLLAGLCNGLYMVGIQVARIPPHISGLLMTFYIMLFGALFCLVNAWAYDALQWISGFWELGLALLLALVTAVFSNLTMIMSIKRIGSTLTSILGVMEPLTAVIIGILVFREPLTWHLAVGVLLICLSVLLAIMRPKTNTEKPNSGKTEQ